MLMATELTKKNLQQAYIKNKASATGYKGRMRVDPNLTVWDRLGNFLEKNNITPEYYVGFVFEQMAGRTVYPNHLLQKHLQRECLDVINNLKEGSELEEDFDEIRKILVVHCIQETGQADLGHIDFKKALWSGVYDGIPPVIRVLCLYPEAPNSYEDLNHPLVKDMLQRAYYGIKSKPEVRHLCERLDINYTDLLNWRLFYGIS